MQRIESFFMQIILEFENKSSSLEGVLSETPRDPDFH